MLWLFILSFASMSFSETAFDIFDDMEKCVTSVEVFDVDAMTPLGFRARFHYLHG